MVTIKAFIEGDVYIDYPYEDVKFRFEKETGKVYKRRYGGVEMEIPGNSKLYYEARRGGCAITREEYFRD